MRKSVDLVGKCVFLLILVFSLGGCGTSVEETSQYTAVIDAGSSGSRIYLYRVEDRGAGKVPNLIQTGNIKVEPGLSSYAANPQQAGESLLPLIDYALQHLPSGVQESTTLHLFATAGMRELSEDSRNSVMAAVRIYLEANTPFIFDGATDAMTIAGAYEGLYGWMAVNYIQDQFDPAGDREGIMEMGGASTQIAFLSNDGGSRTLYRQFNGKKYVIYSKSFLGFGQNSIFQTVLGLDPFNPDDNEGSKHPACLNPGIAEGTWGSFYDCQKGIVKEIQGRCSSNPDYCLFTQPKTPDVKGNYLAYSVFYDVFGPLGLEDKLSYKHIELRGGEVCRTEWGELKQQYSQVDPSDLRHFCFNMAYFDLLFDKGYRFANLDSVETKEDLHDTELTWAIGAALDTLMGHDPDPYTDDRN